MLKSSIIFMALALSLSSALSAPVHRKPHNVEPGTLFGRGNGASSPYADGRPPAPATQPNDAAPKIPTLTRSTRTRQPRFEPITPYTNDRSPNSLSRTSQRSDQNNATPKRSPEIAMMDRGKGIASDGNHTPKSLGSFFADSPISTSPPAPHTPDRTASSQRLLHEPVFPASSNDPTYSRSKSQPASSIKLPKEFELQHALYVIASDHDKRRPKATSTPPLNFAGSQPSSRVSVASQTSVLPSVSDSISPSSSSSIHESISSSISPSISPSVASIRTSQYGSPLISSPSSPRLQHLQLAPKDGHQADASSSSPRFTAPLNEHGEWQHGHQADASSSSPRFTAPLNEHGEWQRSGSESPEGSLFSIDLGNRKP